MMGLKRITTSPRERQCIVLSWIWSRGGITRYRVWKVPESKFFNLTFHLILAMSYTRYLRQERIQPKSLYPLDIEGGASLHQL